MNIVSYKNYYKTKKRCRIDLIFITQSDYRPFSSMQLRENFTQNIVHVLKFYSLTVNIPGSFGIRKKCFEGH